MAVQTEDVRDLVDFAPKDCLVTSFYLDVDAGKLPSDDLLETAFDSAIHDAESKRKEIEESLSHDAMQSIRKDLEKIREFFSDGFDHRDTSGVAIFSCSGAEFWEVMQLPTCVDNHVHFGPRPYVSPIAAFLSHTKPTAILLTDRQPVHRLGHVLLTDSSEKRARTAARSPLSSLLLAVGY